MSEIHGICNAGCYGAVGELSVIALLVMVVI